MHCKIVAFGDSNTRYWLGDLGIPGPPEDAWPARLEDLLRMRGLDAIVTNQGYPGEQADFALAEFGRITAGADLCVLGFGTNDVKKPEVPLDLYLAQLSALLQQAAMGKLPVIVLGIPWFDQALSGLVAQSRIPAWNEALAGLCGQHACPFLDLYHPFLADKSHWFNEGETPKRHLSGAAQAYVAQLLLPHVLHQLKGTPKKR